MATGGTPMSVHLLPPRITNLRNATIESSMRPIMDARRLRHKRLRRMGKDRRRTGPSGNAVDGTLDVPRDPQPVEGKTMKLQDKIPLVTGASSGIGAGIAKALAAEGATVIVNYATSRKGADGVV